MNLICRGCGDRLKPTGSRAGRLVVSCKGCHNSYTVECDIEMGDVLYVADAMPQELEAVGHVAEDPWVFVTERVTVSQRDIIRTAIQIVKDELGPSTRSGRALELICADFISGAHP